MKFDYKRASVPRKAFRHLSHLGVDPNSIMAYKVREQGSTKPLGIVVGSSLGGKKGWGYMAGGEFFGGKPSRHEASERLRAMVAT